jgi:LPS-assembly lipoprotein
MWSSDRRGALVRLALVPLLGLAGGCGFAPMYGEGAPARQMTGRVEIGVIEGAAGFAMRERLTERLGEAADPTHRLAVDLELRTVASGITRRNDIVTYSVIGTTSFRLIPLGTTEPVLRDRLTAQTAYTAPVSKTSTAFASEAARQDAELRLARLLADRVVMRIAVAAGDWAA